LAGKASDRRDWVGGIAGELLGHFRIELYAYALLANGVHLVLRPRPDLAQKMDAEQVARAGHASMPIRGGTNNAAMPMTRELLDHLAETEDWLAEYRQRLGSISWFMRCCKQRVSQRANREDGALGHFWDTRFSSAPLDERTDILAAMAQVDALAYLGGASKSPETAPYTSLRARLSRPALADSPESALADCLHPEDRLASGSRQRSGTASYRLTPEHYAHLVRAGCGLERSLGPAGVLVACDLDGWRARVDHRQG